MPGYSQFSIKVSFPTPFPQYLLTLPFFFFYPAFFLNWVNFVYTQPEEICQDKKETEADGQVALTFSNPTFNDGK